MLDNQSDVIFATNGFLERPTSCALLHYVVLFSMLLFCFPLCFSFFSHKEFRFLMPILPLCMHYCGVYFQSLCRKPYLKKKKPKKVLNINTIDEDLNESFNSSTSFSDSLDTLSLSSHESALQTDLSSSDPDKIGEHQQQTDPASKSDQTECIPEKEQDESKGPDESKDPDDKNEEIKSNGDEKVENSSAPQSEVDHEIMRAEKHKSNLSKAKILVLILIITNVPIALYFSLIHQRGTVLVTKYIYDVSLEKDTDVLFLMPCHSTPYYRWVTGVCHYLFRVSFGNSKNGIY